MERQKSESGNSGTLKNICACAEDNFSKLKCIALLLPLIPLGIIAVFLYTHNAINIQGYISVQKDCFYFLNAKLSQLPGIEYNLTQFGDALIFLSLLSIAIIYRPKVWECLISALLVSAVFSCTLKKILAVPRPAAALSPNSFTIIGKTLAGNNSLPSGHSITMFAVLTVLLYAFMPKKLYHKILWNLFILALGLFLVFTRVAVGAHYPIDVITGGILGYFAGILGILISRNNKIWAWIGNKKYYPILILLFLTCCISLITKIAKENLVIFYFALGCLMVTTYKIICIYVKK